MDESTYAREGDLNIHVMRKKIPVPSEDFSEYFPFIYEPSTGSKITKKEMDIAIALYRNLVPAKPPEIQG
jgi:hypothetical protein